MAGAQQLMLLPIRQNPIFYREKCEPDPIESRSGHSHRGARMTNITNLFPHRYSGLRILSEKEISVFEAVESRASNQFWTGPRPHGNIGSGEENQPTRQNQKL